MGREIKIRIAGQGYSMSAATPEIERLMRLAAESVSEKVATYDAKYADRSMVDKLAFAALNESIGRLYAQERLSQAKGEAQELHEVTARYLEDK